MMNKIKSPTVLMSFSKLMDAVSDCFVTSLSQEQISALVRMQLASLSDWDIQSYTVTGTGGKSSQCYSAKGQSLYVMKPDENSVNQAKELIASVLGGEGTVSDTQQTPEKTEVYTPTADPNAGTSVRNRPTASLWRNLPRACLRNSLPMSSPQNPPPKRLPRARLPPKHLLRVKPAVNPPAEQKHLLSPCPRRSRWNLLPTPCIRPLPPCWMPCSVPAAAENKTG